MITHLALVAGKMIQNHFLFHWMFKHRNYSNAEPHEEQEEEKIEMTEEIAQNQRHADFHAIISDRFKLL